MSARVVTRASACMNARAARLVLAARRVDATQLMPAALLVVAALFVPARAHASAPRTAQVPQRAAELDASLETAARQLVASPLEQVGPRQALFDAWIASLEQSPDQPLADAALQLLRTRLGEAEDPAALAERVLALDPARFGAVAERELRLLQGELAVARWPLAQLETRGHELYPGWLQQFWVLGPLDPVGHPLALQDAPRLFSEPRIGADVAGAGGRALRWRPYELTPWQMRASPEQACLPDTGWMLLAACFDLPASAPGWLELDARGSAGLHWLDVAQGTDRSAADVENPSFAWSLNGAAPRVVDFITDERSALERAPVLWRAGVNRLVVRLQIGARLALGVRVLDADGRPLPVRAASPSAELGAPPSGVLPPLPEPQGAESTLRALASPGPDARALLGVLALLDARPFDGLGELSRASELAPQRPELAALLAREQVGAPSLPESWRRSTSRAIAEKALAQAARAGAAGLSDAEILLARALVLENKEEEAITSLERVAARGSLEAWLELERVWPRLGLLVQAEAALDRANELAPRCPAVLARLASRDEARGRSNAALAHWQALREHAGASEELLDTLAKALAAAGRNDEALALRAEAARRFASSATRFALADQFLQGPRDAQRLAAARELYRAIADERPAWARPWARLADCAQLAHDERAQRDALAEALLRDPPNRALRERVRALEGTDPVTEQMRRHEADLDAELARFDTGAWDESVVRLLDTAVVRYFEDGSSETLTRNLIAVRDLAACKREGTQSFPGEALAVAIHKADGTRRDPVRTSEGWVLPGLAPNDLIEVHYRRLEPPRADGALGPERWFFASLEDGYQLSRLVAILPRAWEEPGADGAPPRLALREKNFTGTHTVELEGDTRVHVLELRGSRRIVPEPGLPPREQFLPQVEFGARGSEGAAQAALALDARLKSRISPWLRKEAQLGIDGHEARARALYARLPALLDQRAAGSAASATATLLLRQGNAAYLYAALLRAADVPCDLVWSREIAPAIEPDPTPLVLDPSRWRNGLYVQVLPRNGAPTWCDPSVEDLPYGSLENDAPLAEAVGGLSGRALALPDVPLEARPATQLTVRIELDAALATRAELELWTSGNGGFRAKQSLRSAPQAALRNQFAQQSARLLPGFQMQTFEARGLADADAEPRFAMSGSVSRWIDTSSAEPVAAVPLPPSRLVARFAGGEGARRLPYLMPRTQLSFASARIELPQGWRVRELPNDTRLEAFGGRYLQHFEASDGGRVIDVRREIVLPPIALAPADYAAWQAHCQAADDAERVRLVFVRG